jgi:hypothetical protein
MLQCTSQAKLIYVHIIAHAQRCGRLVEYWKTIMAKMSEGFCLPYLNPRAACPCITLAFTLAAASSFCDKKICATPNQACNKPREVICHFDRSATDVP